MVSIDSLKNELFSYASSKDKKNVKNTLKKAIELFVPLEKYKVFDMIGQVALNDPVLLMRCSLSFQRAVHKQLLIHEMFEMDNFILKNYCLYPGETIIGQCWGDIHHDDFILTGRLYITPFRVIAVGVEKIILAVAKAFSQIMMPAIGSNSIGNNMQEIQIMIIIQKLAKDHLKNRFSGLARGDYGISLPIIQASDIETKEKSIHWTMNIKIIGGNGDIFSSNFSITPRREKNQPKDEFYINRSQIIAKFYKVLTHPSSFLESTTKFQTPINDNTSEIDDKLKNLMTEIKNQENIDQINKKKEIEFNEILENPENEIEWDDI
jgi:hypothetical protein